MSQPFQGTPPPVRPLALVKSNKNDFIVFADVPTDTGAGTRPD
jgi:hypothetical protein